MKIKYMLILALLSLSSISLALEKPNDLLNKLKREFSCEKAGLQGDCLDNEENHYGEPEITDLGKGYKLIAIYDKQASGTMSLFETFMRSKNGKFYNLGQTTASCIDKKNLLLFQNGHCSAEEAGFTVSKIDLKNKRLITIKSFPCINSEVRKKYMQDNFPNNSCDF